MAQVGRAWSVIFFRRGERGAAVFVLYGTVGYQGANTSTGLDGFSMAYRGIGVPVGQTSAKGQPLWLGLLDLPEDKETEVNRYFESIDVYLFVCFHATHSIDVQPRRKLRLPYQD